MEFEGDPFDIDVLSPPDWARMYRSHGLQVVPCHIPRPNFQWKRPALTHWKIFEDELVSDPQFAQWYGVGGEHVRRINMGLITGRCSGNIFVIDLDDHKTSEAHYWWRGTLETCNHGFEPETWQQRTGGGGRQLFFRAPPGWVAPTNRTPIGVDIRGQGGFAVIPPSLHDSGCTYQWLNGCAPWDGEAVLAEGWLLEAVGSLVARFGGSEHTRGTRRTESPDGDLNAFGVRVDGREDYMTRLIWATLVDLRADGGPVPPTAADAEAAYDVYERAVKSRLHDASGTRRELLEREGRGHSLFMAKWKRAMEKWHGEIAGEGKKKEVKENKTLSPVSTIKFVNFTTLLTEIVNEEPDYIEPCFAGPGNFVLIAGPPKSQKSMLLQEILISCATGAHALCGALNSPKPLKVFYLQAEMNRKLLRKRARSVAPLSAEHRALLATNLIISERFHLLLNDSGVQEAAAAIKSAFPNDPPDIIGIDPLANVFDGESENDNTQIMQFLTGRVETLRRLINPSACVIMVHHATKRGVEELARDPFVAIRGGGALRGYYDSAIVIYRKGEETKRRMVHFELRSGESPEPMEIEFSGGKFVKASALSDISKDTARRILNDIDAAWNAGEPMSNHPRSRNEGRYVVRNMVVKYGLEGGCVSALIEAWLQNKVVVHRERKWRKHPAGLQVMGTIDG